MLCENPIMLYVHQINDFFIVKEYFIDLCVAITSLIITLMFMIIIEDTILSVSVLAESNISIFNAYLMLPVIIGNCFNKRYFLDNFWILFQSR